MYIKLGNTKINYTTPTYDDFMIKIGLYAKPLEPTKEEQLAAILGSSDKVSEIMELFKKD